MKKRTKTELDPKSALSVVAEKGYRDAEGELGHRRSTLFELRKKYSELYDELSSKAKEEACAAKLSSDRTTDPQVIVPGEWPSDEAALRKLIPEPVHPAADRLPLWPFEKLCAAAEELKCMQIPKLPEPIKRLNGEIGRNRRLICLLAGVAPDFEDVELPPGLTADQYVEVYNVLGRQLSPDQLATYAASKYAKMRKEGKLRRTANLRKGTKASEVEKSANRGSTLAFLSNLYGVNRRYIQDAAVIKDHNPKLFRQLRDGKVSMAEARKECGLGQSRPKKPPVDDEVGVGGVKPKGAKGVSEPVSPVNRSGVNAVERSRLLTLARAVEEACRQMPEPLKPQFEVPLTIARQAIRDFDPKNTTPQES
jgi:hypothetical protein